MLRCITNEQVSLYAFNCEESPTRELSRAGLLLCPNCLKEVRFNKGPKKTYFSHLPKAECVVTNYEKETRAHLEGKNILFKWLTKNFSDADIVLEKYIPETKQIADILVTHTSGEAKGSKWAFEFQHSPLSSKDWEERHELYQSANIHDFWILDTHVFLKHSNSKDPYIQKARNKKDPGEIIFDTTGFCYFLNLDKSEITVDFKFRYEDIRAEAANGRRFPPKEYKFHTPYEHSCKIDNIKFEYNQEFNFAAMNFEEVSEGVLSKFDRQKRKFEKKKQQQWEEELKVRARKKKEYSDATFGEEFSNCIWRFLKANKEDVKHDVFELPEENLFSKYNKYTTKLQCFEGEINKWETSTDINHRIIYRLFDGSDKDKIKKISFLEGQNKSLEDYLKDKFAQEIEIINYVLNKYDHVFEKLTSHKPEITNKILSKINFRVTTYKSEPTKFDYAYEYRRYKSKEEADSVLKEIDENFPFPRIDISKL
ncbi:hypothetical protein NLI92_004270 [Priestia megaterium]|uniref:competence protein CoiA n=1 Tax=Priestia megaterium TaxID=1404 RepID=UPI0021ACDF27|nr:competence protein CoiA family protein [Priestia megaterium]MCR8928847.1 hypothetical protein [Priestia megaterium]